jgi:hypothetical protein
MDGVVFGLGSSWRGGGCFFVYNIYFDNVEDVHLGIDTGRRGRVVKAHAC